MKRFFPLSEVAKGRSWKDFGVFDKLDIVDKYNECAVTHNDLVTTLENRELNLGKK